MAHSACQKLDLIVIGSGLAGTAAACFAVARGLKTAQVSATGGELAFASGLLDLLAIYPPHEQKTWDNPWAGIATLINGSPHHPYAKLGIASIRKALGEFLAFLDGLGFEYCGLPDQNVTLATAAGTLKTTYRVPQSMWRGVIGLRQQLPTLLVDFEGMKDFSARQMVEMLRYRWPKLRAQRIPFPQTFMGGDCQNPQLAEALESSAVRAELVKVIRSHLSDAQLVGMPAVLGLRAATQAVADLEDQLGLGVFEIPTLPPSVPSLRLREGIEEALQKRGAQLLHGRRVTGVQTSGRRCTGITIGTAVSQETLEGEGVILATGRFLGGGLAAGRNGISETVCGLPVTQPRTRDLWHREQFLDPRGHPIHEAGLEIDERFRPLGPDGAFAFKNLFAAGSVLAHQDWVRTKSGAGLAIATAYGAVEAFLHYRAQG